MATGQEQYDDSVAAYRATRDKVVGMHDGGLITPADVSRELVGAANAHGLMGSLPEEDHSHLLKAMADGGRFARLEDIGTRLHGFGTPEAFEFIQRNFRDRRGEN